MNCCSMKNQFQNKRLKGDEMQFENLIKTVKELYDKVYEENKQLKAELQRIRDELLEIQDLTDLRLDS
jgi:cell shape-determining protein MreC